jgi:hypothetical protein
MEKLFETALFTRTIMHKTLVDLPYESLVKIPTNFRNSIFWNIAHVLVTQQLLCYKLSGQKLHIDKSMVEKYAKGTIPTEHIEISDILYVREHLVKAITLTREDYKKGIFNTFSEYPTSTGIVLKNIEDALSFSAYHDGIHLGVVLSLKKMI